MMTDCVYRDRDGDCTLLLRLSNPHCSHEFCPNFKPKDHDTSNLQLSRLLIEDDDMTIDDVERVLNDIIGE